MRKRMSRMKKEMAVAVAAAMCISLVGCGGGSSKKVVADKKEAVETTVAETTETETTAVVCLISVFLSGQMTFLNSA